MDAYRTAARESLRLARNSQNERYILDVNSSSTNLNLKELWDDISSKESPDTTASICENLLVAEAFLKNRESNAVSTEDEETGACILRWTARKILPSEAFAGLWEHAQFSDDDEAKSTVEIKMSRIKSSIGMAVLHELTMIFPIHELDDAVKLNVLTALAAFTRPTDPWTTDQAFDEASRLLDAYEMTVRESNDGSLAPFLSGILKTVVKPSFSKTKNVAITPAGRKNEHPVSVPRFDPSLFDEASKPWKFKDVYVVTVLTWIVEQYRAFDHSLIEAQFPFLVPPILALIDDDSLAYKAKGCDILHHLLAPLEQAKSDILRRTNLDSVFQDALSPCLLSLPTITPETESVHLLRSAYPALFSVIQTRFPTPSSPPSKPPSSTARSKTSLSPDSSLRITALTHILRHNILPSYHHTSNPRPIQPSSTAPPLASYPHPSLSTLLLANLTRLIPLLGPHIIGYLQEIVPVLTETLTNPFGTACLDLLIAAGQAAREVVLNAWMRVWRWRAEVLRGVCMCWIHVEEDEGDIGREQGRDGVRKMEELKTVLKDVVGLLRIAVEEAKEGDGGDIDVEAEYRELVEGDERLKSLLLSNKNG